MRGLRSSADGIVHELIELQEKLNLSTGLTEQFLRIALQGEFAESQLAVVQADLANTRERIGDLAARRSTPEKEVNLQLIECGVISGPVNLAQRLRVGGLGALLTLFTVAFGQWWLSRRP